MPRKFQEALRTLKEGGTATPNALSLSYCDIRDRSALQAPGRTAAATALPRRSIRTRRVLALNARVERGTGCEHAWPSREGGGLPACRQYSFSV